jgi:hypothetical protein
MAQRVAFQRNVLAAEVFLGGQGVVRRAAQSQVGGRVGSASRERLQMVKLEVMPLTTTPTARVDVSTLAAISTEHFSSLGCGDVSTPAPARC